MTSFNNMANVYQSQGDYPKALECHEKSLRVRLKALGTEHASVGNSFNGMASVYQSQGDYPRALEFFEKSLRIKLKTLGPEHPSRLGAFYGLANLHRAQGDTAQARELFTKCAVGYEAKFGPYEWARNARDMLSTL
jgi:tetratricopeptide (TPR) repeat protein